LLTRGLTQLCPDMISMLDDHGFELYEKNQFPIAYLLTFRTYATWLPGDPRSSYKRDGGRFGIKRLDPERPFARTDDRNQSCSLRSGERSLRPLRALNIRSNHGFAVVSKPVKPEKIVNDFKIYATRALRTAWYFSSNEKVWARGASTALFVEIKACSGGDRLCLVRARRRAN
jgi:hypothetical protein